MFNNFLFINYISLNFYNFIFKIANNGFYKNYKYFKVQYEYVILKFKKKIQFSLSFIKFI